MPGCITICLLVQRCDGAKEVAARCRPAAWRFSSCVAWNAAAFAKICMDTTWRWACQSMGNCWRDTCACVSTSEHTYSRCCCNLPAVPASSLQNQSNDMCFAVQVQRAVSNAGACGSNIPASNPGHIAGKTLPLVTACMLLNHPVLLSSACWRQCPAHTDTGAACVADHPRRAPLLPLGPDRNQSALSRAS
jgi:hypothetical protein